MTNKDKKCYNTFSCIASVIIIIAILGGMLNAYFVTFPEMHSDIREMKKDVGELKSLYEHQQKMLDSTFLFTTARDTTIVKQKRAVISEKQ